MKLITHYAPPVYAALLAAFAFVSMTFCLVVYRWDTTHPGVQFPLEIRTPMTIAFSFFCSISLGLFVANVFAAKVEPHDR